MEPEKLEKALGEISEKHVAQAAKKRPGRHLKWIAPIAAVLALAILIGGLLGPLAPRAYAVAEAKYPDSHIGLGPDHDAAIQTQQELLPFFQAALKSCLTGAENEAFSPANLYMALAELAELADGEAREEILAALGAESIEALRTQARGLWESLYYKDEHSRLTLANSLWLDESLDYHPEPLEALSENYYASIYRGEFGSSATDKAVAAWLDRQTGGLLKKATRDIHLAPAPEMVFALYSTIYFQAKWGYEQEFNPKNTVTEPFHAPSGDVNCDFMRQTIESDYYFGLDYAAASLGLRNGSRMWFILPDEGKTPADLLESGAYTQLLTEGFADLDDIRKYMIIHLSVPKFDVMAQGSLTDAVKSLGVEAVFDWDAGAFAQVLDQQAWLSGVNQATRVVIDEEGVKAASYIEMPAAGAAQPPDEEVDLVLDRPFLFLITSSSGTPLFAGVVNNP